MNDYDLTQEINALKNKLRTSVKMLRKTGIDAATAEMNYKILLRQEALKLRDEGMAIGMIDKVCYGIPSVAKARFDRDVSAVVYKANEEAINALKMEIRITDNQIGREWGGGDGK